MKKLISVLVLLTILFSFVSCGASWEQTKKNFKSDFGGGLYRHLVVYDFYSQTILFDYKGKCYIDEDSKIGDISIIYYNDKDEIRKADFIGKTISVKSIEL